VAALSPSDRLINLGHPGESRDLVPLRLKIPAFAGMTNIKIKRSLMMGSLTSRPKVPAAPKTVYAPLYSSPAPAASVPLPAGADNAPPSPPVSPEEQAESRRGASLLERRRGVLSTVLTGFRGILDQATAPQRKTLLGE
jgi:hypothetical protein